MKVVLSYPRSSDSEYTSPRKDVSKCESALSVTASCLPALTGLRALAALTVLTAHFFGSGNALGQLGVQLFFVLSAYLMCLLYMEAPRGNTLSARAHFGAMFLYNRIVRIVPLALMVLFVSHVFLWAPTATVRSYAIFAKGIPMLDILLLRAAPGIMWTITVEFAFYIAFSLLLMLPVRTAQTLMRIVIALSVVTFRMRPRDLSSDGWGLVTEKAYVYKFFALGALCYEIHRIAATSLHNPMRRVLRSLPFNRINALGMLGQLGASALLISATFLRFYSWQTMTLWNNWTYPCDALVICGLLLGSIFLRPIRAVLSWRPIQHLGKISYSFYLTHMFVFKYLAHNKLQNGTALNFFFFLLVNAVVSTVSFYTIEKPTMNVLRRRGARSLMPDWVNVDGAACAARSAESPLKNILPLLSPQTTLPAPKSNGG